MNIDWQEHIATDVSVADGKAVIKGTRITVEFITGLLASGWTVKEILKNYPKLKERDIQAAFAFIHMCFRKGLMFDTPKI